MPTVQLPEAELEVLACLHRAGGGATARRLREALSQSRPMTHGAMLTLLKRLQAKRVVRKRKGSVGKAFVYSPVRHQRATLVPVARRFVQRVFGGDVFALVGSLFETRPPTRRELEQLESLLERLRRDADGGRK